MVFSRIFSPSFRRLIYGRTSRDLLHLVLPSTCGICGGELPSNTSLCGFCKEELLYTNFELYTGATELDKLFWGRVRIEGAYALLYFSGETSTQKILHAIKYQNKPETGCLMGREIGRRMQKKDVFKDLDALVPVPIHPKKRFVRGYNQSEELAKGIGEMISVPVKSQLIKKKKHTGSQTKKGRFARWENVSGNFWIKDALHTFKHIAIVDDVITTGATIESLVKIIHEQHPELRVSILSLALTK